MYGGRLAAWRLDTRQILLQDPLEPLRLHMPSWLCPYLASCLSLLVCGSNADKQYCAYGHMRLELPDVLTIIVSTVSGNQLN